MPCPSPSSPTFLRSRFLADVFAAFAVAVFARFDFA